MNRSKSKGTSFETQTVNWLREQLDDDRIERRALHGSHDLGDIYGLYAHGLRGIIECKNYAEWSDADLIRWERQTVSERDNADADFAMLVVKRGGVGIKRFGRNHAFMTLGDCLKIDGFERFAHDMPVDRAEGLWVQLTLDDVVQAIKGEA